MWNLRKHWISEVLDHQAHAMRLGPAGTEDRAGLRFASLEGHARPAQLTAQPDQPPVMRAFVQKERLAGRDAVHVDSVLLQLVWKRLLDVEDHSVNARMLAAQTIEHFIHILGIIDCAVEIGAEPINLVRNGDFSDANDAIVVPFRVVAAQFDL